MAYTQDISGIYPDDTIAQLELKRRLARADALRNQPMPEGQMVSGRYVAPSWTQYLANIAGKYYGGKQEEEALKNYNAYQEAERKRLGDALEKFGKTFEPKSEVTQSTFEIQKPVTQTQVQTSPYGTTEQLGATSPWTNNQVEGTQTVQVPMATTTMRQPTMNDIRAGFAQYARDTRNPKLLESLYIKQFENMMTPKKPIELGAGGKLIDPTTYEVLATNPKESAESKSNLEKEYDFMVSKGYQGSAQDYFDMKRSMTDKERNDLDIKLKQLGIDQFKLWYETGLGTPPGGSVDVNKQALDWANAHPNDPRAAQIKSKLGVK